MKEFWDQRYSQTESAYGDEPNAWFKAQLLKLPVGNILLPAEGEGRNAIFAAKLGWKVSAFDMSEAGKLKAEKRAATHQVALDYQVGEFSQLTYPVAHFDAIGLIYAHFPAQVKSRYHQLLSGYLRPGGVIIFEAFSKSHLKLRAENEKAGGPRDIDMLFSTEELQRDFDGFDIIELAEKEVVLNEGLYHNGRSAVIRFVGKKR